MWCVWCSSHQICAIKWMMCGVWCFSHQICVIRWMLCGMCCFSHQIIVLSGECCAVCMVFQLSDLCNQLNVVQCVWCFSHKICVIVWMLCIWCFSHQICAIRWMLCGVWCFSHQICVISWLLCAWCFVVRSVRSADCCVCGVSVVRSVRSAELSGTGLSAGSAACVCGNNGGVHGVSGERFSATCARGDAEGILKEWRKENLYMAHKNFHTEPCMLTAPRAWGEDSHSKRDQE